MGRGKQTNSAVEQLLKSGALQGTMKTLGGMGGAADVMGDLLLKNQDKIVNGLKGLEKKYEDLLKEGGFEGLTYSFALTEVEGKNMIVALLMPYREDKENQSLICGKPIEAKNLAQFVKMLISGAKNLK